MFVVPRTMICARHVVAPDGHHNDRQGPVGIGPRPGWKGAQVLLAATGAPLRMEVSLSSVETAEGALLDLAVRCLADGDVVVQGGEVALITRLAYKHAEGSLLGGSFTTSARRTQVRVREQVPGPWPLAAGEEVSLPVRLALPADGPGTTHCALVDIAWAVRVRLQVQGYLEAEASRTFLVRSRAADRAEVVDRDPVSVARRCARLRVESLSSRWLAPGRALTGTLVIEPLRACSIRGIRVALVLRQQVHHGEWLTDDASRNPAHQEKDRDTIVVVSALAGTRHLEPDVPVALPFTLVAPRELPAPSLSTPNFTVSWLLRAVVDRPLRPDPYVEVELHGRTTLD